MATVLSGGFLRQQTSTSPTVSYVAIVPPENKTNIVHIIRNKSFNQSDNLENFLDYFPLIPHQLETAIAVSTTACMQR
jgi:hypothetical protein